MKTQLWNLKKGNLSITDYLAKLEKLADQCAATSYIVQDEDLVMYALVGLGSCWRTILTVNDNKAQTNETTIKEW